jgi:hypothetical protein
LNEVQQLQKHYKPTPLKILSELASLSPAGLWRVIFGARFKYYSLEELINELKSGKTLIRWGDGETALARNKSIWFQTSYPELSTQLNEFWKDGANEAIFALPKKSIERNVLKYLIHRNDFWKEFSSRVYFARKYVELKHRTFGDTYIWYVNTEMLRPFISDLLNQRPSMLIASNTDIFDNLKVSLPEIAFLQIPKREIYKDKDSLIIEIANWVKSNQGTDRPIILLAAGPVGKIIARTMDHQAQFVDVGHGFILELGKEIIIVEREI